MNSKNNSLYAATKLNLIEEIRKMDLSESNKLPREEVLAENMGVSRVTIRQVLAELSQEGIVFRKHGRGTFVNSDVLKINTPFCPALEFDDIIRNSGKTPKIDVVDFTERPANAKEMEFLRLLDEERIIEIKKVVYADGVEAIFCIDIIPKKMLPLKLEKSDFERSIFKLLDNKTNRKVVCDIVEISSVLNAEMYEFPDYANSKKIIPLLLCGSINYDTENTPVIYGKVYYNTEYIKFRTLRRMDSSL